MNAKVIITIGIIVLLLPHLGFPSGWDTVFYSVMGAVLVLMSLKVIYKEHIDRAYAMYEKEDVEAFSERNPYEQSSGEAEYGESKVDEADSGVRNSVEDGGHESEQDTKY